MLFGGGEHDLKTSLYGAFIVDLSLVSFGWIVFVFSRLKIGYKLGPGVLNFDFGGILKLNWRTVQLYDERRKMAYGRPEKVNLFFSSLGKIDRPIEG